MSLFPLDCIVTRYIIIYYSGLEQYESETGYIKQVI
jgi:hypothetical protein